MIERQTSSCRIGLAVCVKAGRTATCFFLIALIAAVTAPSALASSLIWDGSIQGTQPNPWDWAGPIWANGARIFNGLPNEIAASAAYNIASGQLTGQAGYGDLTGDAQASMGLLRPDAGFGGAAAGSTLNLTWYDRMTVFGPAGYTGPIALRVSILLNDSISDGNSLCGTSLSCGGKVQAKFDDWLSVGDSTGSNSQLVSTVLTYSSGQSVDLGGFLTIQASACGGFTPADFPVCAPGTDNPFTDSNAIAQFFIDPLTPGATIVTDTGTDYQTPSTSPVPEPGPAALLTVGGVWLVYLRRRI
jgi:hypothetical protein